MKTEWNLNFRIEMIDDNRLSITFLIRIVFKEFGKVQYVEFRDSKTDVLARCATPEDAETLLKSLGEGKVVAGEDSNVLTGVLVEGEEEEAFWKRKDAKGNEDNKKGKQKRGNGGAWGGKGKKFGKKKW